MQLNTLNSIIDDILLQWRNSTVSLSEKLSRIQVEQWVNNYRVYLIKQEIDKGYDINPMYIQTIEDVHLDREVQPSGHVIYVSDKELPKLINLHYSSGVLAIKDKYGNIIQMGSETKAKLQQHRKYTCKDYIAWLKGNKIQILGDSNQLEWIDVDVILENPADAEGCFDPDGPYPAPANMIPTIKDLIFSKELNIMGQVPTDLTNNTKDDNQVSRQ